MRKAITVSLPDELRRELDRVSKVEGVSRSALVQESIRDYLFVRQFRALRKGLVAKAAAQGIHTDQDVFDRVS
jgi:metal-responsive CopG/Arc/MetJ family transcriptional regulator